MTEQILALAMGYGTPVLGLAAALTCLGIPIPSSLLMMAAGSLGAAGVVSLAGVFGASLLGAVAGDQAGFAAGRYAGAAMLRRLQQSATARAAVSHALTVCSPWRWMVGNTSSTSRCERLLSAAIASSALSTVLELPVTPNDRATEGMHRFAWRIRPGNAP